MDIGNQIKKRRTELHMTQEELASKLEVVRTAVSNWESGRNYPDLQMIVKISDVLDVSLDQLLKGDEKLVQQISEDTTVRKTQGKSIKKMRITIVFLVVAVAALIIFLISVWGQSNAGDVSDPNEISAFYLDDNNVLHIQLDLPGYIGVTGYMAGSCPDDSQALDISYTLRRGIGKQNQHEYDIPLYTSAPANDPFSKESMESNNIREIHIVNEQNEEIYSLTLPNN